MPVYIYTYTSVPLSRNLVFIASDGMLMALYYIIYKVISFSPSIKKKTRRNIYECNMIPPKNITKYNSLSKSRS